MGKDRNKDIMEVKTPKQALNYISTGGQLRLILLLCIDALMSMGKLVTYQLSDKQVSQLDMRRERGPVSICLVTRHIFYPHSPSI